MASPGDAVVNVASPPPAEYAFDVFILHAADDRDFVRGYLVPALNLPAQRVLLVDDLRLGAVIVSEIDRGVSCSRFTVVVLSPAYLRDRWAAFGEQLAIHLSVEDGHVIPLRLADVKLPLRIDARVALDFTDQARWDSEVARLRSLLHTTAPVAEPIPCPYPGMRPFAEHEAMRFFGRAKEIDELVERLDHGEREIYVIGPSGSGKSSLVHAGLLPVLNSGLSRLGWSFLVRTVRPGQRPNERLAKALEGDLALPIATVDGLLARHPPATRVLVIIDQLEELFTLAVAAERQQFIVTLRTLRGSQCHFVLTLRADFYGAFMDSELWPESGGPSRVDVAPLRGAALAHAILGPAGQVGMHLERRLCDRLVADAAAEPGALPHVQETLRLLWDKRRHRLLGLAEYEALGNGGRGLDVAIARRADATIRGLTATQQLIARRVLLRLVVFGEGRADTRRQQKLRELRSATDDAAEFSRVLQRLIGDRLVTVDGDERADDALVDLAHEALITAWPAFQDWIAHRRADERLRRRLEAKVFEWIERGRGTASLLDPVELSETEQWMQSPAAHELGYGPDLTALVAASRTELDTAQRRHRRRTQGTLAVLVPAALIAMVAWGRWRSADRQAEAQHLLEQGQALIDEHPMQALPYLVAARVEGIDSLALHKFFARAARAVPSLTLVGKRSPPPRAGVPVSPDGTRTVTISTGVNSLEETWRVSDTMTANSLSLPLDRAKSYITLAMFSPDGTRIMLARANDSTKSRADIQTMTTSATAQVWDVMTGKPTTLPFKPLGRVKTAAFSPDNSQVITVGDNAQIWNAKTGKLLPRQFKYPQRIKVAAFSSDGARVITGSLDGVAQLWDTITWEPILPSLQHQGTVEIAAFSPNGTRVVTGSGNTILIWNAMTSDLLATFELQDRVSAATFSPDGKRLVTACSDNTARVWDITGSPVIPPLRHQWSIESTSFSPDGTRVITASDDRTARVWDAITGKPVTPPLEHDVPVKTALFRPDGQRVVTVSMLGTTRVWDATGGTLPLEHRHFVAAAAFSPSGKNVITGSQDRTARVWDAMTGKPVIPPLQHAATVTIAAFSPEGTRAITASEDQTARIWDATTGKPITPPLEHQGGITAAMFSPDGTRVLTASGDGTARIWSATTGKLMIPPLKHETYIATAAFNVDGSRVVTASNDNKARVWDATTGKLVTPLLGHQDVVTAATFSPDGTRVVTASEDNTACVWDAMTGRALIPPLRHRRDVRAAAFSPDGLRIVTASDDKTARVWDTTTGQPITPPLEHQQPVTAASFSPDGTRVVTVSQDNTAWVWDTMTGQPVTALEHQDIVTAAAFSPDGRRVVTASHDNTARIWDIANSSGSLEDWQRLLRCAPFALVDGVLTANRDPLRVCSQR